MKANIKLGRIWGIPIGLNYSWFLIFALVTFSLASSMLPMQISELVAGSYWTIALIISLLFFGSVLAHELGHALLALRNDVPVKSISLFLFGGVAQIAREPRTPGAEFRIAIAGPLVSLALSLFFGLIYLLVQDTAVVAVPALWLARINLILAIFNMIPGFPLDGGRARPYPWPSLITPIGPVFLVRMPGRSSMYHARDQGSTPAAATTAKIARRLGSGRSGQASKTVRNSESDALHSALHES